MEKRRLWALEHSLNADLWWKSYNRQREIFFLKDFHSSIILNLKMPFVRASRWTWRVLWAFSTRWIDTDSTEPQNQLSEVWRKKKTYQRDRRLSSSSRAVPDKYLGSDKSRNTWGAICRDMRRYSQAGPCGQSGETRTHRPEASRTISSLENSPRRPRSLEKDRQRSTFSRKTRKNTSQFLNFALSQLS